MTEPKSLMDLYELAEKNKRVDVFINEIRKKDSGIGESLAAAKEAGLLKVYIYHLDHAENRRYFSDFNRVYTSYVAAVEKMHSEFSRGKTISKELSDQLEQSEKEFGLKRPGRKTVGIGR